MKQKHALVKHKLPLSPSNLQGEEIWFTLTVQNMFIFRANLFQAI